MKVLCWVRFNPHKATKTNIRKFGKLKILVWVEGTFGGHL